MCRIICGFWLTKRRKQHGTCQDIDVHSAALAAADGHIDRLRWCAHIRWKWWVLSDIFFRLKLASPCPQNESSRFHLWQSWNRFIRLIVTSNGFQWFLFFFGRGNTFRSKKKMTTRFQLLAWETVKQFWASEKKNIDDFIAPFWVCDAVRDNFCRLQQPKNLEFSATKFMFFFHFGGRK